MRVISILLILLGIVGIMMGMIMFGDIGVACIIGSLSALLSGIGLFMVAGQIKKLKKIVGQ